ncbi:MAG: hypothetical protein ACYT04_87250, partial [Nostoc sp.]
YLSGKFKFPLIPLLQREATTCVRTDVYPLFWFPLIPLLQREATLDECFLIINKDIQAALFPLIPLLQREATGKGA